MNRQGRTFNSVVILPTWRRSPNCRTPLMQDAKKVYSAERHSLSFFFFLEIMANKITHSSIWENLTWWWSIDISRTGPFILPKDFNTKCLPNFPLHQTQSTGRADKWYLTQFQKWSCEKSFFFFFPSPKPLLKPRKVRKTCLHFANHPKLLTTTFSDTQPGEKFRIIQSGARDFGLKYPLSPMSDYRRLWQCSNQNEKDGFRSRLPGVSHSCVPL